MVVQETQSRPTTHTPTTPKQHACHFGTMIKDGQGRRSWVKLPCRCWSCPHCRETLLIPQWTTHLDSVWKSELAQNNHISRDTCHADDWDAVYRRLHRHNARYACIRVNNLVIIYHTDGKRLLQNDNPAADAQKLAHNLNNDLHRLPEGRKAISTCRAWKLPDTHESQYQRICNSTPSQKAIQQVVEEAGGTTEEWSSQHITTGLHIQIADHLKQQLANEVADNPEITATVDPDDLWIAALNQRARQLTATIQQQRTVQACQNYSDSLTATQNDSDITLTTCPDTTPPETTHTLNIARNRLLLTQ